jgi:hypothetical protein
MRPAFSGSPARDRARTRARVDHEIDLALALILAFILVPHAFVITDFVMTVVLTSPPEGLRRTRACVVGLNGRYDRLTSPHEGSAIGGFEAVMTVVLTNSPRGSAPRIGGFEVRW